MAELTVSQIIKITIGLLVVVAVVAGAGMYFKDSVISFFGGLSDDDNSSGSNGEVNLSGYVPEAYFVFVDSVNFEKNIVKNLKPFI